MKILETLFYSHNKKESRDEGKGTAPCRAELLSIVVDEKFRAQKIGKNSSNLWSAILRKMAFMIIKWSLIQKMQMPILFIKPAVLLSKPNLSIMVI